MKLLQALHLPIERRSEVRKSVADMSHPGLPFYTLLLLSAAIAAFGLLIDSTAVVIGAMLVAPLMGPIFGIAMGLITGSRKLIFESAFAEATGVVTVLVFSMLVGAVSPIQGLPQEVLSRTEPTIYDILIALASGLAGAYALVSEKMGAALPGVAISTALVPPLASSGICFAAGEYRLGGGAFLLFLANFLAIELAAAGVFTVHGLAAKREEAGFKAFFRQYGWSAVLLVGMSWYFVQSLVKTLQEEQLRNELLSNLSDLAELTPGARLDGSPSYEWVGSRLQVIATVLTPRTIDEELVMRMESELRADVDQRVDLIVRSVISSDRSATGPVFLTQDENQQRTQSQQRAELQRKVRDAITSYLEGLPGAELEEVNLPARAEGREITAVVNAPIALVPQDVAAMQERVIEACDTPYELKVRTVLTVDASAKQYLYQPEPEVEQLTPEQQQMKARLTDALWNQLGSIQPGAELLSVHAERARGRWAVRATVRTPQTILPEQVAQIQAPLRQYISADIDLAVKSVVEADATANGFVRSAEDAPGG